MLIQGVAGERYRCRIASAPCRVASDVFPIRVIYLPPPRYARVFAIRTQVLDILANSRRIPPSTMRENQATSKRLGILTQGVRLLHAIIKDTCYGR